MVSTLQMAANGRLVVAASIRKELGLGAEQTMFLAEVRDGHLILTPADVVPRSEREWLAGTEVADILDQADGHIADGEVEPLTRDMVKQIRARRKA